MAVRHDTDGDGRLDSSADTVASVEYYATPGLLPAGGREQPVTGCPATTGGIGYELTADIDLSELESQWRQPANFQSLTRYDGVDTPWTAVFDGKGFTISGIDFRQPGRIRVRLFGEIGSGGVVRNLGLVASALRVDQAVGAVAGVNHGTIENVYVLDGDVADASASAGLVFGENCGWLRNFWGTGSVAAPLGGAGSAAGANYGSGRCGRAGPMLSLRPASRWAVL